MPIDERMVRWDDAPKDSKPGIDARMVKWDGAIEKEIARPYEMNSGLESALNIAQALTFEHADEIGGKLGFDPSRIRSTVKDFRDRHPYAAALGSVSGSLLLPLGGAKLAAMNPLLAASVIGGGTGALQGLGEAETLDKAPREMAIQGATGAALGPAFLGMAKPVGSVLSALGTKIPGVAEDIAESLARRQVVRSLARDNVDLAQAGARMAQMGPEARIADIAGENTRGVLNMNAYLPGRTAESLENLIENRIRTRPDRMDAGVVDAVSSGMGRAKSLVTALTNQQRQVATPLYQRAHSQSIPADADLIDILGAAKKLGAFGEARTIATAERNAFSLDNLADGNPLAVRDLDYVKRGLDSMIEANTNEFGKLNSKARAFVDLKKSLLSRVDDMSPDFAAARQAFAGPESLKSAVGQGKRFWNENADRLDDIVADMSESERQAFRVGAAEKLREMAGFQTGQNRLLDLWKDRNTRERMKSLLGYDVKFSQVEAYLKNESTFKKLERLGPSRGSRTAQVEGFNENQSAETLSDMASAGLALGKGDFAGPIKQVTKAWARLQTPETVRDGIGRILMKQYAPDELKALLEVQEILRRQAGAAAGTAGTAAGQINPFE